MADFLQTIDTIQAEVASTQAIYEGEGASVKNAHGEKLAEAAKLVEGVITGKKPSYLLQEAMKTTDFSYYFGNILDRQMLEAYREVPSVWQQFAKKRTVPDFRTVQRLYVDGGDGPLSRVNELGEYQPVTIADGKYEYSVHKYGKTFGVSWETIINDDLDAIVEQPERFARAARRTEDRFAASLIAASSGFFTEGHKNLQVLPANTAAMTVASLTGAMQMMNEQTDPGAEPIYIGPKVLMVPPELEIPAKALLNSIELQYNGTDVTVHASNFLTSGLTLVVNPYLAALGDRSWYLMADPADGRGCVEMGFLRGHEEPEIFMKNPNAIKVGGGVDPLNGSFENDSVEYKVRHVLGGTLLDFRYAVRTQVTGQGGSVESFS